MTTQSATPEKSSAQPQSNWFWRTLENLPGTQWLKNISIGRRLLIGFGVMILITLVAVAFSYLGSRSATGNINITSEVRVPTALASAQSQASLLRMLGDVRGYLALGRQEFRDSYSDSRTAFENNLAELESYSPNLNQENRQRLVELRLAFEEWSAFPEKLFELRDDQLEREPAYKILATDGILLGGTVLIEISEMIETQGRQEPTAQNIEMLADMAQFQGTFASMLSGLRGYVTTRNRLFKGEYEANLAINHIAWEKLQSGRDELTPGQQQKLDNLAENRDAFLELPAQIFEVLESDRWREDLFLFSQEIVPLTNKMQQLLADITVDQQLLLQSDLRRGRDGLDRANQQILFVGLIAMALGIGLAVIFRENIAGPVRRLTGVAEQIREGDLKAQAQVEAGDEIGTLASTFNNMTGQLRNTLVQVQKEKKRADDLLEVVIPIGVELSAEKDFNRLLENMLVQAKQFCNANAGILYLRREKEKNLRVVIVRNDRENIAMGGTTRRDVPFAPLPLEDDSGQPNHRNVVTHVSLSGSLVNIADTSQVEEFDFVFSKNGDAVTRYQAATSMLTIPLKNSQGKTLGVLQLLDPQDFETNQIVPFDDNLQQMMESFSSLAAAALEAYIREQSLKLEIQQLRIEIDETKRQQQVSEIVDTDFFSDLQTRAQEIRSRGRRSKKRKSDSEESDS